MKLVARSGLPGKIRIEVQETGEGIDIDNSLNAYTTAHEMLPWLQALLDSVNAPKGKSMAPPPKSAA